MRKLLFIVLLAGLLVLALSVPAFAGASDPPNAFGQLHKTANWGIDPDDGSPVPPGHRDITNSPYPGNPGAQISMVAHLLNDGLLVDWDTGEPIAKNLGDFFNQAKAGM
jgi:hypothetical protein